MHDGINTWLKMWPNVRDNYEAGPLKCTHGISVEKALKACGNVSVLVSMAAPRPRKATAPSGRGVVMMLMMVPTKTASRCHACSVTPAGGGKNQMAVATPTEMPRVFMLAPHLNSSFSAGGGAAPDAATTAVEAQVCNRIAELLRSPIQYSVDY